MPSIIPFRAALLILTLIPALLACSENGQQLAVPVHTSSQTDAVIGIGDAADDPAIWIHPWDRSKSLILGTDKRFGLLVFDLTGNLVQKLPLGRLNNVDVVRGHDELHDFAMATNYDSHEIAVLRIHRATGFVEHWYDIPTEKLNPYGICATVDEDRNLIAIIYKDGAVQLLELMLAGERPRIRLDRMVRFGGQTEGCVFDEREGRLFIGEEDRGIWAWEYRVGNSLPSSIDEIGSPSGLVADVEGLAIWRAENGQGWLVASAQGSSAFVVYDLHPPHAAKGAFRLEGSPGVADDPVTHTDGIDLVSAPIPGFPRGLLVVQDDWNSGGEANQNFKLVHWGEVEEALNLPRYEQAASVGLP